MKVRTLEEHEREALLDLLDGWESPSGWSGRAGDFFRRYVEDDPTFADENVVVGEERGRLVSCVQIVPRLLRLRGESVPTGGIGNVFTRPEARGTGIASALLVRALEIMRARGMELSLLFATRLAFYGRHGWRSFEGHRALLRRAANAPPAHPPAVADVSAFDEARDFAAVSALHAAYSRDLDGTVVRDAAAWRATLRNGGNPLEDFRVARRGGEVVAYARAVALSGFLVISELGRGERDAEALASLVDALLTPREADPLATQTRPSPALRALAAAPALPDAALATALAARGFATQAIPDPSGMFQCLDPAALARRLGERLAPGEDGDTFLRRMLPPERFVFWTADRF